MSISAEVQVYIFGVVNIPYTNMSRPMLGYGMSGCRDPKLDAEKLVRGAHYEDNR